MLDRLIRAFLVVGGVSVACAWTWPGAFPEADPVAVLVRYHTPNVYRAVVAWYYVAPGVAVFLAGQLLISTSRIWFARMGVRVGRRSRLPRWPLSPSADGPAIVVGEVHHPVRAIESPAPEWLTIPERGLYTGVAIFGAVGSGKTSACMHPFARQLFGWQATNPERRAAALVLEVKGDFCHDIRRMLTELGRAEDYIELSLDGRLTWNPLSATWLDSYSLAYTVASLLNQLFGKGKEPFWQQAYTNLVRWIIELYRVLPGGWVTLRDVYHCAIDKALFAKKIQQAQTYAADMSDTRITIAATALTGDHLTPLRRLGFQPNPADLTRFQTRADPAVFEYLKTHTITYDRERVESTTAQEIRLRVEAVNRWYVHDWNTLDNKIRSSIVEGVSVFLSMFDLPSVARVFCPAAPEARRFHDPAGTARRARHRHHAARGDRHERRRSAAPRCTDREREGAGPQHARRHQPGAGPRRRRHAEKCVAPIVVAPAGDDEIRARPLRPAGRLYLRRIPSLRQRRRGRSERRRKSLCAHPAVPGDPHRRHAIHQLAALRAGQFRGVADAPADAPHPHLFELERRGQRRDRLEALWAGPQAQSHLRHQRNLPAERDQFSVRPGRRRARQRRGEQEFHRPPRGGVSAARLRAPRQLPGDLSPLRRRAVPATPARVPEAPLSAGGSPVLARETDRPAMTGDSLDLLKPFLPGLEAALDDPDVSEIMINGPGNVWLEGHGRLRPIDAPALDAAALERAAIHIARPLGLDPATTPILDARLGDGSRVAICVPPASPHVAITVRRFGTRSFSAAQLVAQGALPEHIRAAAEKTLHTRRNILVSGGTGSGKTTLLNALIELIPDDERIVAIEDTLELRIDSPNCVRFEARGLQQGAVTIRDLVKHALRHRPDHIVVGEVRGGEAADLLQALNTGHGGSLTTVHANNAESALSRLASCAMQGGGDLPWDVTCRGVVDGIAMVIHMTRADGRRVVEEAAYVNGYDAGRNAWDMQRLDRVTV